MPQNSHDLVTVEEYVKDTADHLRAIADNMERAVQGFRDMADKVEQMVVKVVA